MKENHKGARFTNGTVEWKGFLNVRQIKTQQSSERESWKCARYKQNNLMKENPKSARDTNVTSNEKVPKITRDTNITIQWKRMLKVREMLM